MINVIIDLCVCSFFFFFGRDRLEMQENARI